MTKVCFLVSSLCNEGPVNVMYNIIQYMDFSKFKVSIITFIPEKKTTRIKDFQKYPLSIHQLAPETPLNPFALFTALKQEVKLINPDMLHAHCPRSLYLMCFYLESINESIRFISIRDYSSRYYMENLKEISSIN